MNLTLSGVDKSKGIRQLENNIENFNIGTVFSYENSGGLAIQYNDCQAYIIINDYIGNVYNVKQRKGLTMYPVEHKLDMTEDYKNFVFTTPEGSVGCKALNII